MTTKHEISLQKYIDSLQHIQPIRHNGHVAQVIGLVIESIGPAVSIGELCLVRAKHTEKPIVAEVVGFKDNRVLMMPLGEMRGIGPGSEVIATGTTFEIKVSDRMLGRIINGMGEPIDGGDFFHADQRQPIYNKPPNPLLRERISAPLATGIKAIDAFLTCGRGQRVGIFAGSGVGKSVLLGMIARGSEADVNVIGLIGERGREVRDFIEKDLGEEGLKRSVLVVATSDEPSLVRVNASLVALAVAEYFRDQGKKVMLMMDSVTRFCMAQREIGLAIGEPPTTKGYTPSVFAALPKLLERAGNSDHGSITGLFTVLVEGDDMNDPVADSVRSILDGHIVLSRDLAAQNHYPAIDVLRSASRVMIDVVDKDHLDASRKLSDLLAAYRDAQDLINIGAYVEGSNRRIDNAIKLIEEINGFLRQYIEESSSYQATLQKMKAISAKAK